MAGPWLLPGAAAAPRDGGGAIRYAEPIRIERALPAPAADGGAAPRRLDFEAYGRRFELELQSNEAILGRLPAERRRALPPRALYKGRLVGQAGSWARLTLLQDGLHGLIHDGRELYLLAPAGRLRDRLVTPVDAAGRETVLFRAADAEGSGGTCATDEATGPTVTQAVEYESVARELSTLRSPPTDLATGVVGRELQMAILGDLEYSTRRLDPEGDLLALVNAADGIFATQAGVTVTATEVRAFRQFPDPFDAFDARDLLDEVADYRNSTASIRATDVAHLATGRDLAGTTVGIAFRGAVCDPRNAASLSEQGDPSSGYLIFAHELGHNLGAPHDGESGSACSFEPRSYLMAPSVNFSSRLSPCSVEQIRAVVDSASCLGIAPADGQVALVGPNLIGAFTTQQVAVQFDVASTGGETLRDVRLEVSTGGLAVLTASAPVGSCTTLPAAAECRLGDLAPGALHTIGLLIDAGTAPGQYPLRASLSAANDAKASNNLREATIRIQAGVSAEAIVQQSPAALAIGGRDRLLAAVRNSGVQALLGLNVDIEASGTALAIDSIAAPGATCTNASPQRWRCSYAEALAPGASTSIDAALRGLAQGSTTLTVRPLPSQLGTATSASTTVFVKPLADVALVGTPSSSPQAIEGRPFKFAAGVVVDGIETSRNVVLRGVVPEGFTLRAFTGASDCRVDDARSLRCTLGDRAPTGTVQPVELEFGAVVPGVYPFPLEVSADNDVVAGNNARVEQVVVVADVDLALTATGTPAQLKVGRSADYGFLLTSTRRPVPDVTVRFGLSATHLLVESATTPVGRCAIGAAEVLCTLGELPPDAALPITLRVRGVHAGSSSLFAEARAAVDADFSNQSLTRSIEVLAIGDAGVRAEAVSGQPRQGQPFEFAPFRVVATRATEIVTLDLTLPASVRVESAAIGNAGCTLGTGSIQCSLGNLAAGDDRALQLRIVASEVGPLAITARTRSEDDDDPSNDSATVQLNVTTVIVQPPPTTGGGGGGGGGALDPTWLLLLLGGLAARPRRRVRA